FAPAVAGCCVYAVEESVPAAAAGGGCSAFACAGRVAGYGVCGACGGGAARSCGSIELHSSAAADGGAAFAEVVAGRGFSAVGYAAGDLLRRGRRCAFRRQW